MEKREEIMIMAPSAVASMLAVDVEQKLGNDAYQAILDLDVPANEIGFIVDYCSVLPEEQRWSVGEFIQAVFEIKQEKTEHINHKDLLVEGDA
jgi:hypothetical protein|tara:strand:+ start:5557 stop:5835 length:279 start_codon:yes stop_codon:yes gene_type:complete